MFIDTNINIAPEHIKVTWRDTTPRKTIGIPIMEECATRLLIFAVDIKFPAGIQFADRVAFNIRKTIQ